MADAVATTVGAVLGTSTTTTFVESASGVTEGGRTGLTSLTTAILFGISLFLSPIFLAIPSFATAPALIIVGFYMLSNVAGINFSDYSEGIPCFICIAAMPFCYSISEGISMGVISYVVINVITGKAFGSAYVTMNSKAIGADMVYAWPEAEIGMMAADMAAKIMYTDADADTLKAKTEEYKALQSSPLSAAGRGYVDTIIEPADTRKYVIGAFEMLFTKREERPSKKHGTI